MAKSRLLLTCLFLLVAGGSIAQGYPSKPLTLLCPFTVGSSPDLHLRLLAKLASGHLGQPMTVENNTDWKVDYPPAEMARTAAPDGYSLALLSISAFRIPHLRRLAWDPTKLFTYIIGVSGYTFGVVVRSDSQFKSFQDLIDYAKANPGRLAYSSPFRGSSPHFAMMDLGFKTGARFLHVPSRHFADAVKALADGHIMAIAETTVWGPSVDSGAMRLLVTFGEQRSRWNAPTAKELGLDVLSYSPFGIVGPKGMDPKVTRLLHDAFNKALDHPEYDQFLRKYDMVDWYKSSEDFAEWAVDQFRFQRALIGRTIGLGGN